MTDKTKKKIEDYLNTIYDSSVSKPLTDRLYRRLEKFKDDFKDLASPERGLFHQEDVFLIAYGDMLQERGRPPLQSLLDFYQHYLKGIVNTIHILPFFPYSSDDGFSIIDYTMVDPKLGTWQDIDHFREAGCNLMFDAVINHISAQSKWFQGFLNGEAQYQDYFITVSPDEDLSMVTRPRSLPLLTAFDTALGEQHVWTTFSADQVDLNYANPDVTMQVMDVILLYIAHGADVIRLDAIAYLWKEIGTTCIHLPETHAFVKLLRLILDEVAPHVLLITETNVPHEENMSYFGDGTDEAHLVYQFSLPPLTAHALITGSAKYLRQWAATLSLPSDKTSFFNFTASHDGVGVRPVTGILPDEELNLLLNQATANGGRISSKTNLDGSTSPYELNISYFDLLNDPNSNEDQALQVGRFMASQAIMLMLKGIPGIYLHSLIGSRNYAEGVAQSGQARAINREKLEYDQLKQALADPQSLRHAVYQTYKHLLELRTTEKAFHPAGEQQVLDMGDAVFAVMRTAPNNHTRVVALQNMTAQPQKVTIEAALLNGNRADWLDLISQERYAPQDGKLVVEAAAYQTIWLKQTE